VDKLTSALDTAKKEAHEVQLALGRTRVKLEAQERELQRLAPHVQEGEGPAGGAASRAERDRALAVVKESLQAAHREIEKVGRMVGGA
jgi:hypothetical protein